MSSKCAADYPAKIGICEKRCGKPAVFQPDLPHKKTLFHTAAHFRVLHQDRSSDITKQKWEFNE
jgi:hypothetical protein